MIPQSLDDQLRVDHDVSTPENVSFHYEVAGIGGRFIGALIDALLVSLLLFAVNMLFVGLLVLIPSDGGSSTVTATEDSAASWIAGFMIALYAGLQFAVVWGYFSLFEALWHGQTPGKHLAGTRVVRRDGSPVRPLDVAIRNLVRVVDFLPVGYGLGFMIMVADRYSRRLGDFAAGTLVVHERDIVGLGDLDRPARPAGGYRAPSAYPAMAPLGAPPMTAGVQQAEPIAPVPGGPALATGNELERLRQYYPHFRRLTADDISLLSDTLTRQAVDPVIGQRLAAALAAKMDMPPPSPAVTPAFLIDLWRLAQSLDASPPSA